MQWLIGMPLRLVLSYFALALFCSIFLICNFNAGGKTILSIKGSHNVYQELILFLQTDSKLLLWPTDTWRCTHVTNSNFSFYIHITRIWTPCNVRETLVKHAHIVLKGWTGHLSKCFQPTPPLPTPFKSGNQILAKKWLLRKLGLFT